MRALLCCALLLLGLAACKSHTPPRRARFPLESLRAEMFSPPQVLAGAHRPEIGEEANALVLALEEDSSFRAMSSAWEELRVRGLAVGYWIDLARTPRLAREHPTWVEGGEDSACVPIDSAAGFDAQLERVAALLRERPPADAIFLSGLCGTPLACGCAFAICDAGADFDATAPARFVAALRGFAGGAVVLPVASSAAPSIQRQRDCKQRDCVERGCARREDQVWSLLRAHSPNIALVLLPPPPPEDAGAACRRELASWNRGRPQAQPAAFATTTSSSLLAVLPAAAFSSQELSLAIAAAGLAADGYLVSYCVNAEAGLGAVTAEAASPSVRD